jgi:hypothetical protein
MRAGTRQTGLRLVQRKVALTKEILSKTLELLRHAFEE